VDPGLFERQKFNGGNPMFQDKKKKPIRLIIGATFTTIATGASPVLQVRAPQWAKKLRAVYCDSNFTGLLTVKSRSLNQEFISQASLQVAQHPYYILDRAIPSNDYFDVTLNNNSASTITTTTVNFEFTSEEDT
jgi:hypothetical protein